VIAALLFLTSALAATVDRVPLPADAPPGTPPGAVVTVRPAPNEKAGIVDAAGKRIPLPADTPPMWLVNPDAWRLAVGCAAERDGLRAGLATATQQVVACQTDLDATAATYATCIDRYNDCSGKYAGAHALNLALEASNTRLRRQRVPLVLGSAGAGAAITLIVLVAIAL
jgi:hypothetical protein